MATLHRRGTQTQRIAEFGPMGGFADKRFRVLDREDGALGLDASGPIRLVRLSDGRIGLRDDDIADGAERFGPGAHNAAALIRQLEE